MGKRLDNAKGLYLEGIRDGRPREALDRYIGDRYTQHSTGVRDGKEGFLEFFEPFLERNPSRDIRIVRGWEDGRTVFIHAYQDLNHGQAEWVTTDFFDTDADGQIVEHWDVIAPYVGQTPSGHTSVDGETQITDLDKTAENKAIVRAFLKTVMMREGDPEQVDTFISSTQYIQHNPAVPDGLAHFKALLTSPERTLFYDEIVLLAGAGNFVATLCRATFDGQPYAQVDIFRLEDGQIVEHWDNVEPCPPEDERVNSGKF
ncbi:MAG: nuclear transport factor 2 family protein [Myxococcota bacterium]